MAKYILVMKQCGEGCDYTINCGVDYCIIIADSYADAKEQVKEKIQEDYPPDYDTELEYAFLAEVIESSLPLREWYGEVRKARKKIKKQEIKAKELTQLEKLKKKYNK